MGLIIIRLNLNKPIFFQLYDGKMKTCKMLSITFYLYEIVGCLVKPETTGIVLVDNS